VEGDGCKSPGKTLNAPGNLKTVLLALYQDGTNQGWRCSHITCFLDALLICMWCFFSHYPRSVVPNRGGISPPGRNFHFPVKLPIQCTVSVVHLFIDIESFNSYITLYL